MERKRKRKPYKKPPEVFITDSEYAEIISGLNGEKCKERRDYLHTLLDQVLDMSLIEQSFYSKWGKTKENLAICRYFISFWFKQAIDQIDWENVDGEKLWDIYALLDRGIDPEYEIFERWGVSKENRALIEAIERSRYYSECYERENSGGGMDDNDIIEIIEDGNGDMHGY